MSFLFLWYREKDEKIRQVSFIDLCGLENANSMFLFLSSWDIFLGNSNTFLGIGV